MQPCMCAGTDEYMNVALSVCLFVCSFVWGSVFCGTDAYAELMTIHTSTLRYTCIWVLLVCIKGVSTQVVIILACKQTNPLRANT